MCKHPVCSDCGMIGLKHKNHPFEKLNAVYDSHVDLVRKELFGVDFKYLFNLDNKNTLIFIKNRLLELGSE